MSVQHPLSPVGYAPGVDVRTQQHPLYPVGYAPGVDVRTATSALSGWLCPGRGCSHTEARTAGPFPSPGWLCPAGQFEIRRRAPHITPGLRTEAVPGVQGTGPGLFSERRGISASEPLPISATEPLAISPTLPLAI